MDDNSDTALVSLFRFHTRTPTVAGETISSYVLRMDKTVAYLTNTVYENEEEHHVLLNALRDVWDYIKDDIESREYVLSAVITGGSTPPTAGADENGDSGPAVAGYQENFHTRIAEMGVGDDERLSRNAISRYIDVGSITSSIRTNTISDPGSPWVMMDSDDFKQDEYDLSRTPSEWLEYVTNEQASSPTSSESDLIIFDSDTGEDNREETARILALFCPICRGPRHNIKDCPANIIRIRNQKRESSGPVSQAKFCWNCNQYGHNKRTCRAVGGIREMEEVKGEMGDQDALLCRHCNHYGHIVSDCWSPGGVKEGQRPLVYLDGVICSNCTIHGHQIDTCWAPGGAREGKWSKKGGFVTEYDVVCPNCKHAGHIIETCWAPGGGKAGRRIKKQSFSRGGLTYTNCKLVGHSAEECRTMGGAIEGQAQPDKDPGRGLTCSNCRQNGHTFKTCQQKWVKNEEQNSRFGLTCTNCKRDGHTIKTCWVPGGEKEGRGPPRDSMRRDGPTCSNCKRVGHTIETCWGNGGGLEGQAPRRVKTKSSDKTITAKALSASQENPSFTYVITDGGSSTTPPMPNPFNNFRYRIIIDSACTNHVTWRKDLFVTYTALKPGEKRIALADGTLLSVHGVGTIAVDLTMGDGNPDSPSTRVELKDVIHFKNATSTLLSLAQLRDSDIQATFAESEGFRIKSRTNGTIIGKTVPVGRLYALLVKGQNHPTGSTSSVTKPRPQVLIDEVHDVQEECVCPRCRNGVSPLSGAGWEVFLVPQWMGVPMVAAFSFTTSRAFLIKFLLAFLVSSLTMGTAIYLLWV